MHNAAINDEITTGNTKKQKHKFSCHTGWLLFCFLCTSQQHPDAYDQHHQCSLQWLLTLPWCCHVAYQSSTANNSASWLFHFFQHHRDNATNAAYWLFFGGRKHCHRNNSDVARQRSLIPLDAWCHHHSSTTTNGTGWCIFCTETQPPTPQVAFLPDAASKAMPLHCNVASTNWMHGIKKPLQKETIPPLPPVCGFSFFDKMLPQKLTQH